MSTLGTIEDHMERGGFSRREAEKLEALVLRCDQAAETAAAVGDEELIRVVIEAAQGCIDALTAAMFVERRVRALRATMN